MPRDERGSLIALIVRGRRGVYTCDSDHLYLVYHTARNEGYIISEYTQQGTRECYRMLRE